MWTIWIFIFEIIITIFIFIYLNKVNPIISSVYSKAILKSFIKHSWTLGIFAVVGILFNLITNRDTSLNAADSSYQYHNLAATSANYLKLNYNFKVNFLIFMISLSLIFIVFYGFWFLIILLPLRTLILGALSQIAGFDFANFLTNITDVYIPYFKLWLNEHLGFNFSTMPISKGPWSQDEINRISEINTIYTTLGDNTNNPLLNANANNEVITDFVEKISNNTSSTKGDTFSYSNILLFTLAIGLGFTITCSYIYWDDIVTFVNTFRGINPDDIEPLIGSHTPSSTHSSKFNDLFVQDNNISSSSSSSVSSHSTGNTSSTSSPITVRGLQINTQINRESSLLTAVTPTNNK